MRSFLMFVALVLAPLSAAQAQQTVTTRDIIELSKAGLPEEVLLAVIDVHRPVFPVDTVTLKGLKDAGVAPNVIVAMIKSGRELPVTPSVVPEARRSRRQPRRRRWSTSSRNAGTILRRASTTKTGCAKLRCRFTSRFPSGRDRSSAPSTGPPNRFTGVGAASLVLTAGKQRPIYRRTPKFRANLKGSRTQSQLQLPTPTGQAVFLEVGDWKLGVDCCARLRSLLLHVPTHLDSRR